MEFLREAVDGALTAQKIRDSHHLHLIPLSTADTLHAHCQAGSTSRKGRRSVESFCVFCECNGHWAQDGKAVTDVKERVEKSVNRCFLCLNRGHHTHACTKRGKVLCSRCKKEHHRSVCMDRDTTPSETSATTSACLGRVDISSPDRTCLQTACVWVTGPTGLSRFTRCVLDGGGQCTFIARAVIDVLQLEVTDPRDLSVTAFETSPTAHGRTRFVRFKMRATWTDTSTSLTAFESTHAFSRHAVPHGIKTLTHTRKLMLGDPPAN